MTLKDLSNLLKKIAEIAEKNFEEEDKKPSKLKSIPLLEYYARRAQILNTIIEVINYYEP